MIWVRASNDNTESVQRHVQKVLAQLNGQRYDRKKTDRASDTTVEIVREHGGVRLIEGHKGPA